MYICVYIRTIVMADCYVWEFFRGADALDQDVLAVALGEVVRGIHDDVPRISEESGDSNTGLLQRELGMF